MTGSAKDPTARILQATIAAAAAPAGIFAILGIALRLLTKRPLIQYSDVWVVWLVFFVALMHAVLIGLPAFFVLLRTRHTQWWIAATVGFLIGFIPFTTLGVFTSLGFAPGVTYSVHHGYDTQNSLTTEIGWLRQLEFDCIPAFFGMSGGLAFWAVWRRDKAIQS